MFISNYTYMKFKRNGLQSMFEAGLRVKFGFAHFKHLYVEDLLYSELFMYATLLMCETQMEL